MARRYDVCWKCDGDIKTESDRNYLKTRDGNLSLCPACYQFFLEHNVMVFRPEKSRKEEIERSLHSAIDRLHEHLTEDRYGRIDSSSQNLIPSTIVHSGIYWGDCNACREILEFRCSKYCRNESNNKPT